MRKYVASVMLVASVFITSESLAQRTLSADTFTYAINKMGKDDIGLIKCLVYNLNVDDHLSPEGGAHDFMMLINSICRNKAKKFDEKCLEKTGSSGELCLRVEGTLGPMIVYKKDESAFTFGADGDYHDE